MMKKLISLSLVLCVLLALVGCNAGVRMENVVNEDAIATCTNAKYTGYESYEDVINKEPRRDYSFEGDFVFDVSQYVREVDRKTVQCTSNTFYNKLFIYKEKALEDVFGKLDITVHKGNSAPTGTEACVYITIDAEQYVGKQACTQLAFYNTDAETVKACVKAWYDTLYQYLPACPPEYFQMSYKAILVNTDGSTIDVVDGKLFTEVVPIV